MERHLLTTFPAYFLGRSRLKCFFPQRTQNGARQKRHRTPKRSRVDVGAKHTVLLQSRHGARSIESSGACLSLPPWRVTSLRTTRSVIPLCAMYYPRFLCRPHFLIDSCPVPSDATSSIMPHVRISPTSGSCTIAALRFLSDPPPFSFNQHRASSRSSKYFARCPDASQMLFCAKYGFFLATDHLSIVTRARSRPPSTGRPP